MSSIRFLTNQEFSEQEQVRIQRLLIQATDKLKNAEEQIAQLTQLRAELSTDIFRYTVALAPWKRMPEYVLQLIFLSCLPPHDMVDCRTCLTLTAVCSLWRRVAFNTPELWQAISVKFWKYCTIPFHDSTISIAHQWLKRACNRTRLLRIDISGLECCPEFCDEMIDRLVLPFTFRSLDLTIGYYHRCYRTIERIFSLPHECTQPLNSLRLRGVNERRTFDLNEDQGRFPNLQILDIKGLLQSHQFVATVPWRQLRQLSLEERFDFSPSALLKILHHCVALEKLMVTMGSRNKSESLTSSSFVTIPNLRQIHLKFRHENYDRIFLASLVLPRIEDFLVRGYRPLSGTSQYFVDMIQRSAIPQLQKLHLGEGRIPYRLRDLLKYTPSLTHLEVGGKLEFDFETLEDLLKGRLGPNLKEIVSPDAVHASGINVGRVLNGLLRVRPRYNW